MGTIATPITYVVAIIFTVIYVQYRDAGTKDFKKLKRTFYIPFGITFLLFIAVGVCCIAFTDYKLFGVVWILVCLYVILSLFLGKYRLWIDIVYSIIFVGIGIASFFISTENERHTLVGITVMFWGLFILSFGQFVSHFFQNEAKKRTSIFMHTPNVFPMLEFDIQSKEMKDSNAEPILFSLFIFLVIIWSFITTGLVEQEFRFLPLSIIGLSISFAFVYGI